MKAVVFDTTLRLADVPECVRKPGEVLVRVTKAGICNTDLEIIQGYVRGFSGILGHEFIGIVEAADDPSLLGRRVSAEINCGCGVCEFCTTNLARHCPSRTVLGITSRNGAFAESVCVPRTNVVEIPSGIPDATAVFIEPLAAALEITAQVSLENKSVLLIGDGKLGLLISHVLSKTPCDLLVVGKHKEKLDLLTPLGVDTLLAGDAVKKRFDVVIEASGDPSGFAQAIERVKPRGTIVLKSTYARGFLFNPAPIVVNEITCVGSRCGRFQDAIAFMEKYRPDFGRLISAEFHLKDALDAFSYSQKPGVMKVLLKTIQLFS
jgi:threonine dehydrogenase-like Zn-dependent dehydrogenase